jgi:hypothetical protein
MNIPSRSAPCGSLAKADAGGVTLDGSRQGDEATLKPEIRHSPENPLAQPATHLKLKSERTPDQTPLFVMSQMRQSPDMVAENRNSLLMDRQFSHNAAPAGCSCEDFNGSASYR